MELLYTFRTQALTLFQALLCLSPLVWVADLQAADESPPTAAVMELFTSHGCSSCPRADAVFSKLIAQDPSLIALEFHVDYWDKLVHGADGSFKDPFSSADYTLRQHAYNQRRLEGRRGVYTPQIIVNGNYATVGSQQQFVEHGINNLQRPAVAMSVNTLSSGDSDSSTAAVRIALELDTPAELPANSQLWLAIFDIEQTTEITGGENNKRTLVNHHVVREFSEIKGFSRGAGLKFAAGQAAMDIEIKLKPGQGCAVMLQNRTPGPVHAAAYCPQELWSS